MKLVFRAAVFASVAMLASCGGDLRDEITQIPLGLLKEPYAFVRHGEPQAKYVVAHVSAGKDGTITVVNLRQSAQSGVTFTRMSVRCEKGENRVLASSDTIDGLQKDSPDPRWNRLVHGSSRYYVAQKACAVAARGFGA